MLPAHARVCFSRATIGGRYDHQRDKAESVDGDVQPEVHHAVHCDAEQPRERAEAERAATRILASTQPLSRTP